MFKLISSATRAESTVELGKPALPKDVAWIDLLNGTPDEISAIEQATGLALPPFASLREIEHSSRMRRQGEAITVSLPLLSASPQGATLIPVGFVLSRGLLVTLRFEAEPAFEQFVRGFRAGQPADARAPSIMIGLLETITDRLADRLEETGDELDRMSGRIFGLGSNHEGLPPRLEPGALRDTIRSVGRIEQTLGKVRASLLTGGRIVPYLESEAKEWLDDGTRARVGTLKADVASLDEYESHLADKVQFLQDAAIGLINIEQNDSFKVLTIASVVGIPPTLVASMYGMNFHDMPELSWALGYPYGLAAIGLSAAIPLVWFKVKGWF